MKRFLMAIMVLSLICGAFGAAFADVVGGGTGQTRDILLMEEYADTEVEDQSVNANVTPGVLNAVSLYNYDFGVKLTADKPDGLYTVGDRIVFSVTSEEDAYLTLLDFTPSGQIVVLYPNAWVEDNSVKAGETVVIPMGETEYSLRAVGPVGVDVVKAIFTNKPVQVFDEDAKDVVGPFSVLKDPIAATRDILMMAEPAVSVADDPDPTDEVRWSVASFAVMTNDVGNEGATGFAVVGDEGSRVAMWANRNTFLVGERVFLKFLSDKAGSLVSLVNAGASSKENDLLPDGESLTFAAGEVLTLPRADDRWKLVAAEDTGDDAVIAKIRLEDGTEFDIAIKLIVNNDLEG